MDQPFYWRVQAVSSNSVLSQWSDTRSYTYKLGFQAGFTNTI